jgi:hypothetical protein
MKRIISLALVLILISTALVGCTKPADVETPPVVETPPAVETPGEETPVAEGEIVKFGLGQNISIASSKDAGVDANSKAVLAQGQADVTMAAVGFDKDGKVVSVTVDVAQTKVKFDEDLKVASDRAEEVKSKKELGPDYGMVGASAIGKEWFEQMEAFEDWMIGKTVDEIAGLKVKETNASHQNVPDVAELTSTVTITVESYIAAVKEAWDNAQDVVGADTLGLGVVTSIKSSKDKGVDANNKEVLPVAQVDTTMSATAVDADGKVVGVINDVAQVKIAFDADGKVTTDKEAELKTKKELKGDYGMVGASAIKKEWFEQQEAFEEWMVGKTIDEITGLKVKEANPTHLNVPDVPELTSTVTITVESYIAAVKAAFANKK